MKKELGNGVIGKAVLTHGTMECRKKEESRSIYEELLRLRCVNTSQVSQLVAGAGNITIVCVQVGTAGHPQGDENRWVVLVDNAQAVADMHAEISKSDQAAEVREIETAEDGSRSFVVRDEDSNWWQVSDRPASYYQAIFERGDVVAA